MRINASQVAAALAAVLALSASSTVSAAVWRGLVVAPEDRCAPYRSADYSYPQSIEPSIIEGLGGQIYSPYTGQYFESRYETDIEHIVARSEAHDSGLCRADANTRRRFAQDLLNLTLAAPEINRCGAGGKCAHDATRWLPPKNRCWFAGRVVAVRTKYQLTIDQPEADALDGVLSGCASPEIIFFPTGPAVPFLLAASSTNPRGFVRVVNRSEESGTVDIVAIDDTGERFGPVSLTLEARAVGRFTAQDLEEGASHRGLSTGVGDGSGSWRLEFDTDLDIEARAYAYGPGYVSRVDRTVAEIGEGEIRYEVRFFNPASNLVKRSALRLINLGNSVAEVEISALDDNGDAAPEGMVRLTVPSGEARELSARALENGSDDIEGRLGDGVGKWRLSVSADQPLYVLSLVRGPNGYVASLSQ